MDVEVPSSFSIRFYFVQYSDIFVSVRLLGGFPHDSNI
jgi:hypothetical protein